MISIVEQIFVNGRKTPDKIALLDGKEELSYGGLISEIISVKNVLKTKYGLRTTDRVIIAADKQLSLIHI